MSGEAHEKVIARQRLRLSSPIGPGKPLARHQEASRTGVGGGGGGGVEAGGDRASLLSMPSSSLPAPPAAAAPL